MMWLPQGKRQPNLVFAAYRLVAGTPSGWAEFETTLKDRRDDVVRSASRTKAAAKIPDVSAGAARLIGNRSFARGSVGHEV